MTSSVIGHDSGGSPPSASTDARRLVDVLSSDLRTISQEGKKKYSQVKDVSETALVRLRNISTASTDSELPLRLRASALDIVQPLTLAAATLQPRLVQLGLTAIQRLVQNRILNQACAPMLVAELWRLCEARVEQLRVLQLLTPLISIEPLVIGEHLAKCLAIGVRCAEPGAQDAAIASAASASVRQLVHQIFERVVLEDGGMRCDDGSGSGLPVPVHTPMFDGRPLPTGLRPCALDAYRLLVDICVLYDGEKPDWLLVKSMPPNLCLELLENVLHDYPQIFHKHPDFLRVLHDRICELLVRTLSPALRAPNESSSSVNETSAELPSFPLLLRLLRILLVLLSYYHSLIPIQCEVFAAHLLRLAEAARPAWLRAAALDGLHRILSTPAIIAFLCSTAMKSEKKDDGSSSRAEVAESLAAAPLRYLLTFFQQPHAFIDDEEDEVTSGGDSPSTNTAEPGLYMSGRWSPLLEGLSARRSVILDALDKQQPPRPPLGHCVSRSFAITVDTSQTIYQVIDSLLQGRFPGVWHDSTKPTESEMEGCLRLAQDMFHATCKPLLRALRLLLDATTDESSSESVLKAVCSWCDTASRLAITLQDPHAISLAGTAREAALDVLCAAALPVDYWRRVVRARLSPGAATLLGISVDPEGQRPPSNSSSTTDVSSASALLQVVASSTACPITGLSPNCAVVQFTMTWKSVQVIRVLSGRAAGWACRLFESWTPVVCALQHASWLLSIRPQLDSSEQLIFVTGASSSAAAGATQPQAATVVPSSGSVSADVNAISGLQNKLFEGSTQLDDCQLHHLLNALHALSNDSAAVASSGRCDPSWFAMARLLQVGVANTHRLDVWWRPVSEHLLDGAVHPHAGWRAWASAVLAVLVRVALSAASYEEPFREKQRQDMVLRALSRLAGVPEDEPAPSLDNEAAPRDAVFVDVRARAVDCLLNVLQRRGGWLHASQWPRVVRLVDVQMDHAESRDSPNVLSRGAACVRLIVADLLTSLPADCVIQLVRTAARYAALPADHNVALSAVEQLWKVSDFVRLGRQNGSLAETSVEHVQLVLFSELAQLCTHPSAAVVRKSACDTLLHTVAAHAHTLAAGSWRTLWHDILLPMLRRVAEHLKSASTTIMSNDAAAAAAGTNDDGLIVHHSRNSESKLWAETATHALSGVTKLFGAQRAAIVRALGTDILSVWRPLLDDVCEAAAQPSSELSLAALRALAELVTAVRQPLDSLPDDSALWFEAWQHWLAAGRSLVAHRRTLSAPDVSSSMSSSSSSSAHAFYMPTAVHFAHWLSVFDVLWERVRLTVPVDDLLYPALPSTLKRVVLSGSSQDRMTAAAASSLGGVVSSQSVSKSQLLPVHSAVLNIVQRIHEESVSSPRLLSALPALLRLLCDLSLLAVRPPAPSSNALSSQHTAWISGNVVPLGEACLGMAVQQWSSAAKQLDSSSAALLLAALDAPLTLKYGCPSESTWRLASDALLRVLRVLFPLARVGGSSWLPLWPVLARTLDHFFFAGASGGARTTLAADARRRDEWHDVQVVETLRTELLPWADRLPSVLVDQLLDVLHRASAAQLDPNDVFASDACTQRSELSRACFDALLAVSTEAEGVGGGPVSKDGRQPLGLAAVTSLLSRCKQVVAVCTSEAREASAGGAGGARLGAQRRVELAASLQAVRQLLQRVAQQASGADGELFSRLVDVYPAIVDAVGVVRADAQMERCVVETLHSFQTLMLLKVLPKKKTTTNGDVV